MSVKSHEFADLVGERVAEHLTDEIIKYLDILLERDDIKQAHTTILQIDDILRKKRVDEIDPLLKDIKMEELRQIGLKESIARIDRIQYNHPEFYLKLSAIYGEDKKIKQASIKGQISGAGSPDDFYCGQISIINEADICSYNTMIQSELDFHIHWVHMTCEERNEALPKSVRLHQCGVYHLKGCHYSTGEERLLQSYRILQTDGKRFYFNEDAKKGLFKYHGHKYLKDDQICISCLKKIK